MTPVHLEHPEYRSLLEKVRTYPYNDAPRLIVADWIQGEGNDDGRAGFIRVQCELFRLDPSNHHHSATNVRLHEAISREHRLFVKHGRKLIGGEHRANRRRVLAGHFSPWVYRGNSDAMPRVLVAGGQNLSILPDHKSGDY